MHNYHPAVRLIVRIILLPIAATLHAVPLIFAWLFNLYNWVRYGGEFMVHVKDDKESIGMIYHELVAARKMNEKLEKLYNDQK